MAAGCFASALTRSQIVAAMISFAIGLAFFLAGFMADPMDLQKTWAGQALNCVSVMSQMKDYARGVVDTRSIVFCLTSSFLLFVPGLPRHRKPALEITCPKPTPPNRAFPADAAGWGR
jgi:ABC-2 type transport system permease protein